MVSVWSQKLDREAALKKVLGFCFEKKQSAAQNFFRIWLVLFFNAGFFLPIFFGFGLGSKIFEAFGLEIGKPSPDLEFRGRK